VKLGSSDKMKVGDQVAAIGNPLGELTSTLTVGYVSAKDRMVSTEGSYLNMIQTDAAINSGNSGGPLFNSHGEVVGITTAKYSGSSSSGASIEGIGFAIPIDDVMPLVDDLMNYGYINSAYLGVMVSDVDAATASHYGLPVGAYVQEVTEGYCAEKAGLQAKDIIVAVGPHKVDGVSGLVKVLRKFKAGETTTITVFRGGQELSLTITLDEKPQTTEAGSEQLPGAGEMPQEGSYEDWYNYFAPFFGEGRD
jgi:serine protease Do